MWERVCIKLRFRQAIQSAETMIFMKNYLDQNTLPSTGGDWELFFRTLEEVAEENEQRDVESGASELLMHELWSGTPAHSPVPHLCPARLSLLWLIALY
jgi:hypothetical protein